MASCPLVDGCTGKRRTMSFLFSKIYCLIKNLYTVRRNNSTYLTSLLLLWILKDFPFQIPMIVYCLYRIGQVLIYKLSIIKSLYIKM